MTLKRLNAEPDGSWRVYYQAAGEPLYCWQIDNVRADTWAFYRCSRDGEPSHMVALRQDQPACPGTPTADWAKLAEGAA